MKPLSLCCLVPWIAFVGMACSEQQPSDTDTDAAVDLCPAVVFSPPPGAEGGATAGARQRYAGSLSQLEALRLDLGRRYRKAAAGNDSEVQAELIGEARRAILKTLVEDVFPAWYGTPWDFNGISQTPGEGQIACGYFVTTTLRDAGFDLPRVKLAQQASQTIITSLTGRESISISAGKPIKEIEAQVRESGAGLYIVGLDSHVGFIVNDGRSLAFVHSSYYSPPRAVVAETTDSNNPLAQSNYRVVGKVLDDFMVRKWIRGEAFQMGERKR